MPGITTCITVGCVSRSSPRHYPLKRQRLKVSVASPGLRIERINYDQHGRLIDCDLEYWRHDAIHVGVDVLEGKAQSR